MAGALRARDLTEVPDMTKTYAFTLSEMRNHWRVLRKESGERERESAQAC